MANPAPSPGENLVIGEALAAASSAAQAFDTLARRLNRVARNLGAPLDSIIAVARVGARSDIGPGLIEQAEAAVNILEIELGSVIALYRDALSQTVAAAAAASAARRCLTKGGRLDNQL